VDRARIAAQWWGDLGFAERRKRLLAWKGVLARRQHQLVELIHRENGKPRVDGLVELSAAIEHLDWAARHARHTLGPRRVRPGLLMANHRAYLEYQPLGVIGVIGPWNYPVFTPMGSIAYALAAGNAVVFKPSEYTPGVAQWLADAFLQVVPEHPVLQVITGYGETGAALCTAGVDKIAFTGSTATGKKVMAACAASLTPVLVECGGKDAMIVDADADLAAAADAAAWGGLANAGQSCTGIERVYVVESVYDRFLELLVEAVRDLRPGEDREASYGPITMPRQLDVIRRHLDDALARGAKAVVGGKDAVRPPYVQPTVLVDVPDDAPAVCEETFGPTLVVTRVRSVDEAVDKANAVDYGLGGAVFTKHGGREIARRLRVGMVSVNSALAYAGVPSLPFGGVGASGFGRIHGEDGLREFSRAQAVTVQRFRPPVPLMSYRRTEKDARRVAKILQIRHGRRNP
jgi:acyl-CoA reductase-like NAD-dependent aldehyde dehydrogenase